jgi:hypothetical protein
MRPNSEEDTEIETELRREDDLSDEELDCGDSAEKKSTKDAVLSDSEEVTTLTRKPDEEKRPRKRTHWCWTRTVHSDGKQASIRGII